MFDDVLRLRPNTLFLKIIDIPGNPSTTGGNEEPFSYPVLYKTKLVSLRPELIESFITYVSLNKFSTTKLKHAELILTS